MPFKSEAQKRKFEQLVREGKMSQSTLDEWNKNSSTKLPERVNPKPKKINTVEKLRDKYRGLK